jgi:5-oxoprolinase (ATP-hydrolysing)
MAGGCPGQPGINRVERADGRIEALAHIGSAEMAPGDVFVIETPGGGGYGDAAQREDGESDGRSDRDG